LRRENGEVEARGTLALHALSVEVTSIDGFERGFTAASFLARQAGQHLARMAFVAAEA